MDVQRVSTVIASNRTPEKWLSVMADPLLAQSAVDQLASIAHDLVATIMNGGSATQLRTCWRRDYP